MNITIFLDVDGVLNHTKDTKECPKLPWPNWKTVCQSCINRLNALCGFIHKHTQQEPTVILSSSWRRLFPTVYDFQCFLAEHGYKYAIAGRTVIHGEDDYADTRGQQILNHIKNHPCDRYIVLDDDTFDMQKIAHRQIVTDFKSGFTTSKLKEAINLILLEN